MTTLFDAEGQATISPCGLYRYYLRRDWSICPVVLWIMLNPSTADSTKDDPTIRRCLAFSKRLGAGGLEVVNLYALRSENPQDLTDSEEAGIDPVGPDNDRALRDVLDHYPSHVIAAWGAHKIARKRTDAVLALCPERTIHCLGWSKNGSPRHPLYVPSDAPLEVFRPARP